jgi:prepilin-type N-terminal cleavage/methylation domain-containing protein
VAESEPEGDEQESAMRALRDNQNSRRGPSGFTIIELLVAIAVIAVLIGLLIVVGRRAIQSARALAARQTITSMKQGIEQFKQDHGFLPPMIADEQVSGMPNFDGYPTFDPPSGVVIPDRRIFSTYRVSLSADPNDANKVREREYLRGWTVGGDRLDADEANGSQDRRYSAFSLGVYLAGLGEINYGNGDPRPVVDGVVGPGFVKPSPDGTWEVSADQTRARTGTKFGATFEAGAGGYKIVDRDIAEGRPSEGRVEIRDRKGVAIRYYRWLRGDRNRTDELLRRQPNGDYDPDLLNVPKVVGDPRLNPDLATADYAIVAAGDNGFFGDMPAEFATQEQKEAMARELRFGSGGYEDQEILRNKAREDNIVETGR